MSDHELMTPQQRVQLNHVAKHLHTKFHGIFGLETIEAFVFESFDEMAKTATVTKWLIVAAEKYALQRLEALAHSQDHSAKSGSRRALPVRAQRRALPDGPGLVQPSGRRACHCVVGWFRAGIRAQPATW